VVKRKKSKLAPTLNKITLLKPVFLLSAVLFSILIWIIFRPQPIQIAEVGLSPDNFVPSVTAPASPSVCNPEINSITFTDSCGPGMYRYVKNFTCTGSTTPSSIGDASSCKDLSTWWSIAVSYCIQHNCPSPSPSPTAPSTVCKPKVIGYKKLCNPININGSYRYVNYTCFANDNVRTMGSSSSCKTKATWQKNILSACEKVCKTPASPIPSPLTSPSPTPTHCSGEVSLWRLEGNCSSDPTRSNYIYFQCAGSDKEYSLGGSADCKDETAWKAAASTYCRNIAACYPSPVPSRSPTPTPMASRVPSTLSPKPSAYPSPIPTAAN